MALSLVFIRHILQETVMLPWFQPQKTMNITLLLDITLTQSLFSPGISTDTFPTTSTYLVSSQPKLPENYDTSKTIAGNNTKTHSTHKLTLSLALMKADKSPPALFTFRTFFGNTQQSFMIKEYLKNIIG